MFFFNIKNHFKKIYFISFFILLGCQLQEPAKNHGILFLENRASQLTLMKTNKNDVVKLMGQPHSKTYNQDDIWIYIERTLTKGKYNKLGRHTLKSNNTLVLNFNKYGVLQSKDFYDLNNLNKISFSKKSTDNELSQRSFVQSFLQSIKRKMYGSR